MIGLQFEEKLMIVHDVTENKLPTLNNVFIKGVSDLYCKGIYPTEIETEIEISHS